MPSGYNKDNFMRFLTQKCLFDTQKATWTCYWAATCERAFPEWKNDRERAIAAFQRMLATKKSERVVNLALQSIRTFMMFLDIGDNGPPKPKIPPSTHPAKGHIPITSPAKQEESAAWLVYSAQLIKEVREIIRLRHLSLRTEKPTWPGPIVFSILCGAEIAFAFKGMELVPTFPAKRFCSK